MTSSTSGDDTMASDDTLQERAGGRLTLNEREVLYLLGVVAIDRFREGIDPEQRKLADTLYVALLECRH